MGGDVFVAATLPKPPPGALPQVGEVNNEFGGSTFRVVTAAHAGSPFVRALLNERGNLMKIDYYRGFFGRNGRLLDFVGGGGTSLPVRIFSGRVSGLHQETARRGSSGFAEARVVLEGQSLAAAFDAAPYERYSPGLQAGRGFAGDTALDRIPVSAEFFV